MWKLTILFHLQLHLRENLFPQQIKQKVSLTGICITDNTKLDKPLTTSPRISPYNAIMEN